MFNIFVTSIDENSTKNMVIAGLAGVMQSLGYSVCIYKPVQNDGYEENGKIYSKEFDYISFMDNFIEIKASYLFLNDSNPLVASVKAGKLIDRKKIQGDYKNIIDINECTIIEGVNGLGTTYNMDYLEINMAQDFNLPTLFIVSAISSSLNTIITTLASAKNNGLNIRGVIITDYPDNSDDENIKFLPRFIEEYTDAKVLGVIPILNTNIRPDDLIDTILTGIDIEAVFDSPIAKLQK